MAVSLTPKTEEIVKRLKVTHLDRVDLGKPNTTFKGSISLDDRLESGDLTAAEVAALRNDCLHFLSRTGREGRIRCIDGRILKQLWDVYRAGDDEGVTQCLNRPLGFQTPGGMPLMGLTHRLAGGTAITAELSFPADMKAAAKEVRDLWEIAERSKMLLDWDAMSPEEYETYSLFHYMIGGHIDDHAKLPNTGCGAIDKIPEVFDIAASDAAQPLLFELTQAIMYPDLWDEALYHEIIGRLVHLRGFRKQYLEQAANGEYAYKQQAIEVVSSYSRDHEENMPAIAGPHGEVLVIINKVPGVTFNTDLFWLANHEKYPGKQSVPQAFGWDVWSDRLMGEKFFGEDSRPAAGYVMTRVILGVATTMVLTDGSQGAIILEPIA